MAFRCALFGGAMATGALFNASRNSSKRDVAHASTYGMENPTLNGLIKSTSKVFDHQFRPFKLGEVINLAEDVAIFRFLLPKAEDVFSMSACSTLQGSHRTGTNLVEQVTRCYTPITPNGTKGYFDLLVKKQPDGRMTETLFSLQAGDSILFRVQDYKLSYAANKWKQVGLIGGGTGITPLLQVIMAALGDDKDQTKLSLLFANQRESKILLKGTLDSYARQFADRLKVNYIIDHSEAGSGWKGYTGYIDKRVIRDTMPAPARDIKILVCGPDKMMASLCGASFGVMKAMSGSTPMQPAGGNLQNFSDVEGILGELGYDKEMLYRF